MRSLWARVMHANLSGIMPQVIATWCEQEGHDVTLVHYTGLEDLAGEVPKNVGRAASPSRNGAIAHAGRQPSEHLRAKICWQTAGRAGKLTGRCVVECIVGKNAAAGGVSAEAR